MPRTGRSSPGNQAKVSVLLSTYNHENFIKWAVESVLMQETDFDFELVIIEDFSTDGTRDIVTDFQKKYPDKIRLVLSDKNMNNLDNFVSAFQSSAARYIAMLDGDDFWTSPRKLQRQADFLDTHPECSVCFHNVRVFYEDEDGAPWNYNHDAQREISTLEDLWEYNFIAGRAAMLRAGLFGEFPGWFFEEIWGDWPLYILNAQYGDIGYIDEVMGAYRIHSGGYWSGLDRVQKLEQLVHFYGRMNRNLGFRYEKSIRAAMSRYSSELALQRAKAAERRSHLDLIRNGIDRQQLVHRIGEVVRTALPPGAALIIVGEGNDGSIELGDRRGLRFPQPEDAGPERLFGEGAQGSVEVPWIETGKSYEFLLYTGTGREDPLAAVRVVRDGETPPETASKRLGSSERAFIAAEPNPVPGGSGLGTTTLTWSTGDGAKGRVYVSEKRADAGRYLTSSEEAVAHLEALRARGGEFVVFPATSLWWLKHYGGFGEYLRTNYHLVYEREDTCLVFLLTETFTRQETQGRYD
jgi:glycosyltransferase involved in cell wall biosynthesis